MKFDVLILGGGFGGVYCARSLAKKLGKTSAQRVGLIADQNVMVFQPMLAEVVGATLSPLDVVNPIREYCSTVNVLLGNVAAIDLKNKRVELDAGRFTPNTFVDFEHLVIAMGGVVDLSRVPGMPEHGFILKTVNDALNLRSALISRLEEANLVESAEIKRKLMNVVVVGGGYSGVETAGQILDLTENVRSLYKNLKDTPAKVTLIHSGPHLLPEIGEELGIYAEQKLKKRNLEVLLNARVNAVTAGTVYLADGKSFDTFTVVSTIGNAPHPLLERFCKENNIESSKGRIVTEPSMRVKGQSNVWALGDCAAVPVDDKPSCPPTAQYALRQGTQLGENLARVLSNQPLKPFKFKNLGQLASIGHHTAVANIRGLKFSGFLAWWFWRSVYLFKLPGMERKIHVVVDWTMELFFRRDVSNFGRAPIQSFQEIYLQKGDILFRPGEPSRSFYIIKTGKIDLLDGEKLHTTLSQGEHFGEWALMNSGHWLFMARAAEATTLVALRKELFRTLSSSSTAFRNLFTESARRYTPQPPSTAPATLPSIAK